MTFVVHYAFVSMYRVKLSPWAIMIILELGCTRRPKIWQVGGMTGQKRQSSKLKNPSNITKVQKCKLWSPFRKTMLVIEVGLAIHFGVSLDFRLDEIMGNLEMEDVLQCLKLWMRILFPSTSSSFNILWVKAWLSSHNHTYSIHMKSPIQNFFNFHYIWNNGAFHWVFGKLYIKYEEF